MVHAAGARKVMARVPIPVALLTVVVVVRKCCTDHGWWRGPTYS